VKAGDPERTTIANAARKNPPCVRQIIAILPGDYGELDEVMRLRLAKAEGDGCKQLIPNASANLVCH
jgi:hypothetical protein